MFSTRWLSWRYYTVVLAEQTRTLEVQPVTMDYAIHVSPSHTLPHSSMACYLVEEDKYVLSEPPDQIESNSSFLPQVEPLESSTHELIVPMSTGHLKSVRLYDVLVSIAIRNVAQALLIPEYWDRWM
jgi:hypothetical protein